MVSHALAAAIARTKADLDKDSTPAGRHALGVLEARTTGLVVQVSTPQRGTPFEFDQVGQEAGKPVRERVGLGYVTASKVTLPAHDGSMSVLPGHAPMVGLLGSGELRMTTRAARLPSARLIDHTIEIEDGVELRMFVSGGTFQIRDNEVLVLSERGFLPNRLVMDDLDDEDARRRIRARAADEGLEGEALSRAIRDAKKKEVAEKRKRVEAEDPSLQKEAEMQKIRAMEKLLG